MKPRMSRLDDLTSQCIRCGFCLESCPTFVLTANEAESPRGRIYLAKLGEQGNLDWRGDVKKAFDTCLGCRACETACPSGVKYGEILELAREKLEEAQPSPSRKRFLDGLTNPKRMRTSLTAAKLLGIKRAPRFLNLSDEPATADIPRLPKPRRWPELRAEDLLEVRGDVDFLEGCAMSVLYPHVNEASVRLLRRVGYRANRVAGCCGALHAHSGFGEEASKLLNGLDSKRTHSLLVTNSAGCGSHLKANESSERRTSDLAEVLLEAGLPSLLAQSKGLDLTIAYHDACHLAHGQGVVSQPRQLLSAIPGARLVPLPESDMCCGSAGTYNVFEPSRARSLLSRKWGNIVASGADVVVMGNPGCHSWIAQAAKEANSTIRVVHTAEILEASFLGELA